MQSVSSLLALRRAEIPRTSNGLPALDEAAPHQQCFQATLLTCLLSNDDHRHEWEHPTRPAMASVSCYLNRIVPHRDRVELVTNTACRVASRMLPLLHWDSQISGIPGLRLLEISRRRLRLCHVPTGARLDLVDSSNSASRRDMSEDLRYETQWHTKDDGEPLWRQDTLSSLEGAHEQRWATTPWTGLRSSVLVRMMALVWDFQPVWSPAPPGGRYERLTFMGPESPHSAGELLTSSAARIPDTAYQARGEHEGVLTQGDVGLVLTRASW
ncbi:hypothetical protein G4Z16_01035 [Streptomyces bathyalis]|uniref:Uncharacterized protein n=1 Tax=Streptomyces bathyalis TaxID=2710756 RepID=A0A7T1WQR2_9ACTN|nr:hypothetical protein [Streptomyces bathyalis]QPP05202.1 hypothetical protein G4Z16_01035 [Streptomyces bathyalis]